MNILSLNTLNYKTQPTFKAPMLAAKNVATIANNSDKSSKLIDKLYKDTHLYLKKKIDKAKYIDTIRKFERSCQKFDVFLNEKEALFLDDMMMSLEFFNPEQIPDDYILHKATELLK